MYSQIPSDHSEESPRAGRVPKAAVALGGVSCLLLLALAAVSLSTPQGADASTGLIALPGASSLRVNAQQPRSVLPSAMGGLANLPGPSPWKELALAGLQGTNVCNRDVSMQAQNGVREVVASMNSRDKAIVARATEVADNKVKEMAGIVPPLGFFDPFGLSTGLSEGRLLFYREVEIKHGRVCMLAALGILVAEKFHPLFGGDIDLPAYIAFQQTFWYIVAAIIGIAEIDSIRGYSDIGGDFEQIFSMKTDRIPGDLGFDPLGLKPSDPKALKDLQNKEILNGRLSMIAVAGMIAQELVTGQKI